VELDTLLKVVGAVIAGVLAYGFYYWLYNKSAIFPFGGLDRTKWARRRLERYAERNPWKGRLADRELARPEVDEDMNSHEEGRK
jgi:hypothetical protein